MAGDPPQDGDVLVVAQKIVSKAEGAIDLRKTPIDHAECKFKLIV